MSEKYGEPLTLHIQDGLQKVYPNKRKGPYYFAVATIETSLPSGAYRWNPETNNHDISVGQEIADKAFDDRNEVWSKEVIERMERVVLTYNACANRSESEIAAAFALWDNREKVRRNLLLYRDTMSLGSEKYRELTELLRMIGGCPTFDDVRGILSDAALLQAEKEGKV